MASYAEWCQVCQATTSLVDDGMGGYACGECGCTNRVRSEAAIYHSTVSGSTGEYTLDAAAARGFRSSSDGNDETRWMESVSRQFHQYAVILFSHNRSALPLDYTSHTRTAFYNRCMQLYRQVRMWELEPGMGRAHIISNQAIRLPYQIIACIMLAVHESNLAVAQIEIKDEFFKGTKLAQAAVRMPIEVEVKFKLEQARYGTLSKAWLVTRFQDIALLVDIDISDLNLLLREVVFVRDHLRALVRAGDDFDLVRGDTGSVRIGLEREHLEAFDLNDDEWTLVLQYSYQLSRLLVDHPTVGQVRSYILAIAIVTWAMQAVRGLVLVEHRAVCNGIAELWGSGITMVEKTYVHVKNILIACTLSFGACKLPIPLIARPGRSVAIGDGLSGYAGDARRSLPVSDIAIAAVPTVAEHWREIAKHREDQPEPTDDEALQAARVLFARASNIATESKLRQGHGPLSQARQPGVATTGQEALVAPSPDERAPQEVYDFLHQWRKRLPARRSIKYLMGLELSVHDINNGTLQSWIDKQRWRWCPVEAWIRTLENPDKLPQSLLPNDLESLKRDFELAESLDHAAGMRRKQRWLSEKGVQPGDWEEAETCETPSDELEPVRDEGLEVDEGDASQPCLRRSHTDGPGADVSRGATVEQEEMEQCPTSTKVPSPIGIDGLASLNQVERDAAIALAVLHGGAGDRQHRRDSAGKRKTTEGTYRDGEVDGVGVSDYPEAKRKRISPPLQLFEEIAASWQLAFDSTWGDSPDSESTSPQSRDSDYGNSAKATAKRPRRPGVKINRGADIRTADDSASEAHVEIDYKSLLPPLPTCIAIPTTLQLREIATRARVYKLQANYWLSAARGHVAPSDPKVRLREPERQRKLREHRLIVAMNHYRACVLHDMYLHQLAPATAPDFAEAFRRTAWWCIDRGYDWQGLADGDVERRTGMELVQADLAQGKSARDILQGTGVPLKSDPPVKGDYMDLPAYGRVAAPSTRPPTETAGMDVAEAARKAEIEVRHVIGQQIRGTKRTKGVHKKQSPAKQASEPAQQRLKVVQPVPPIEKPLLLATSFMA